MLEHAPCRCIATSEVGSVLQRTWDFEDLGRGGGQTAGLWGFQLFYLSVLKFVCSSLSQLKIRISLSQSFLTLFSGMCLPIFDKIMNLACYGHFVVQ